MSDYTQSVWEDYWEQKSAMEAHGIAVPFDPYRTAFANPLFFTGASAAGPLTGRLVMVDAGDICAVDGDPTAFEAWIGEVIGHYHKRLVVKYPGLDFYVGWIDEEEVRPLDMYGGELSSLYH